ncbi:bifunctional lytic transglycosylase/C40 family peptidase [Priestia endophytica]|uniref:NlpC/P60 family protein n=1 Tax=Priestia endophytica DSM 13796 TaxID=1121089 RepID=A0A1I6C021_9BACI|nr:bifunctional lytic transglycosylase/C40 family peptidase [Priestia endophytica]KYG33468.1 hypothetical protein AZF06_21730 [Priestia endophytica]SFQ86504.1 NlpC/P60 family protein [Priestia endophytica DSM 13796]
MAVISTKVAIMAAREWKWLVGGILAFIAFIVIAIMGIGSSTEEPKTVPQYGSQQLSEAVLAYQEPIQNELAKYGLEDMTPVLLAILQQESGGYLSRDIFQASESLGLPPNSITDPMYSIQVGVKYFSNVYKQGTAKGVDVQTIIQSYNMGGGYINFVASHGGTHSEELAKQFSSMQMSKNPGMYTCGGDTSNFRYPYCYGDFTYATKVFAYVSAPGGTEGGAVATGSALGQDKYETIYNEVLKYEGYPYAWGGTTPATSFDCSGLTKWAYAKIGINIPRTAQLQYNASQRIQKSDLKPGDLIFFKTASYSAVTHVGIYVGDNRMYDSNNGGIGFSELNNYWAPKIVGYGRFS